MHKALKNQTPFYSQQTHFFIRRSILSVLFVLLVLCVLSLASPAQDAPYDWSSSSVQQLAPGIQLAAIATDTPRPLKLYCARVDSTQPGISFYTTPRANDWLVDQHETIRQTTRGFLTQLRTEKQEYFCSVCEQTERSPRKAHHHVKKPLNIVLAVNADAFSPWPAPWDKPLPTNLNGLAIANGVVVSPLNGTPSLFIRKDGSLKMAVADSSTDLTGVQLAVSGFGFCLQDGAPVPSDDVKHPRTGYGLSADNRFLYLLVIDGRRHASQGCTIAEVGEWLKHFGAYTGINMDGGGSATLVRWNPDTKRAELINEPVGNGQTWHDKDPALEQNDFHPTERANGNNLAIAIARD